ncbi:MAG TPA: MgtC/SapB family protein [Nevskiaceae bacterium]|nr:MgtC/SapB family protein [Nevskiaceae bacterium]
MTIDGDVLLRLGMATLVGALIGLNRNTHGKPAGLRTHALVALGAALAVIMSGSFRDVGVHALSDAQSRVIQGMLTGIGFLGAGVILRTGDGKRVHGLTTAAAIWVAAIFGAACGAGAWFPVIVAFALLLFVLVWGGPIEKFVHRLLKPDEPLPNDPDDA